MSYSAHAHPSCPLVGFSHSRAPVRLSFLFSFLFFQMFYILSLALPRRVSFIYQGNQTRGFIGKTLDIYYDEKNRERNKTRKEGFLKFCFFKNDERRKWRFSLLFFLRLSERVDILCGCVCAHGKLQPFLLNRRTIKEMRIYPLTKEKPKQNTSQKRKKKKIVDWWCLRAGWSSVATPATQQVRFLFCFVCFFKYIGAIRL